MPMCNAAVSMSIMCTAARRILFPERDAGGGSRFRMGAGVFHDLRNLPDVFGKNNQLNVQLLVRITRLGAHPWSAP